MFVPQDLAPLGGPDVFSPCNKQRLSIQIIVPALPPRIDGIGDHTAMIATELLKSVDVSILGPIDAHADSVPGVPIVPLFSPDIRKSVWAISDHVLSTRPDWILLQYNPFGYGKRGLNLSLPRVISHIKRLSPAIGIALMAHERFVPVINWKFAIMATWQRWQFRALGNAADIIFSSIEKWAVDYRKWFPHRSIVHFPVGSNIPRVQISRDEARTRLGIDPDVSVLGVFGTTHPSRLLQPVRRAAEVARIAGKKPLILYIGPDSAAIRLAFDGLPLLAEGPLAAEEVSRRLSAMDVFISSFSDGVSTRRGSLLAALQHGVACVGTRGINTDSLFLHADGDAILLADANDVNGLSGAVLKLLSDPGLKNRVAAAGEKLFEAQFAWPRLAELMLTHLNT